jgi:hypothetical protein
MQLKPGEPFPNIGPTPDLPNGGMSAPLGILAPPGEGAKKYPQVSQYGIRLTVLINVGYTVHLRSTTRQANREEI